MKMTKTELIELISECIEELNEGKNDWDNMKQWWKTDISPEDKEYLAKKYKLSTTSYDDMKPKDWSTLMKKYYKKNYGMNESEQLDEGLGDLFKGIKKLITNIPGFSNKAEVNKQNKEAYLKFADELEKFVQDNKFKKYAKARVLIHNELVLFKSQIKKEKWKEAAFTARNIKKLINNKNLTMKAYKESIDIDGEMLEEGDFGPGTKKAAKIKDKNWKAEIGAIENKKRPEALYILMSSWVKPKLSVSRAKANSTSDPDSIAVSTMVEFKKQIDMMQRKIAGCFDTSLFDTSSIIFTYDFAASQAKVGKRQFIEFEINIDTVNDIDYDGNPAPSKGTGQINNIPFNDFTSSVETSIDKILNLDVFSPKKSSVDFAKTKGAK